MYTVYPSLVLMLWIVHQCPVILWHSQSRIIAQFRGVWRYWLVSIAKKERKPWALPRSCVTWLRWYVAEMMAIFGVCKRKANKHHGQAFATGIRSQLCIESSDVHFKLLISCSFSFMPRFQLFTYCGSVLCMHRKLILKCSCGVASTWLKMTATKHLTLMLYSKKDHARNESFADFEGNDRHCEYHTLWLWIAVWLWHSFYS